MFEGIGAYPKCIFGELSILFRLSPEGLVIMRVDPEISILKETQLHTSTVFKSGQERNYEKAMHQVAHWIAPASRSHRNMFHQLGTPIEIISSLHITQAEADGDSPGYPTGDVLTVGFKNHPEVVFGAQTIFAKQIKSYIHGYRINKQLKQHLREYFSVNPFAVPAEMIRSYSFPNTPSERGIDTQINIPLTHAVEVCVLFPHHHNDITCFLNPKYKDLSLKFLDQSWPDTAVNTTEPQYFKSQLEANLLGEPLQCSNQFENSYMVNYSGKKHERYYTHTDITNFAHSIPIEIPSTNAFFAGGANSTSNTVISLTGNAITQGEEEVYNDISRGDGILVNRTPPIFVAVSNTFIVFGIDPQTGAQKCHYEINLGWNEFFQRYYPELYAQFMAGGN
ncbi:hypothetical protein FACS189472_11090 [Alphaproteobacteria bacterium]|nr:hypothetical protein FACS189472_11090 [Alphaproteobacteria bacterium]